jgi:hypothetical protein|tara:strand:- start:241 stop:642 length:402 start_codon:yes stop_codon:yes gene_type:complete
MMKSLTLILALTLSVMFSSTSFAGWTKVAESVLGDTFYVDFERIRKHGGYVYYWRLSDLLKPNKHGTLSDKSYYQGDCKLFRQKELSASFHTEPMGKGTPSFSNKPKKEWSYPPPNGVAEVMLNRVCAYTRYK